MYRYMNKNEMEELQLKGRIALVIEGVITEDIDEYINNILAVLRSQGLDTNILNQPRISKNKYGYIILLIVKNNFKIDNYTLEVFNNFVSLSDKHYMLADYIKNEYNNVNYKKADKISIKCYYRSMITHKVITGTIKLIERNGKALKTIVNIKNVDNYIVDVSKFSNNINSIIALSISKAYKEYKLNLEKVTINLNGNSFNYNVVPTVESLKLVLIK